MIFDSNDGTLKTSRMYTGSLNGQNKMIKTIIISSGSSPKAYVGTINMATSASCAGMQVFSFNPLTFTN